MARQTTQAAVEDLSLEGIVAPGVGKENLHVAGLVGAAMCSAFECGSHDRWP
jgi:hypothetical protein